MIVDGDARARLVHCTALHRDTNQTDLADVHGFRDQVHGIGRYAYLHLFFIDRTKKFWITSPKSL